MNEAKAVMVMVMMATKGREQPMQPSSKLRQLLLVQLQHQPQCCCWLPFGMPLPASTRSAASLAAHAAECGGVIEKKRASAEAESSRLPHRFLVYQ